MKMPENKVKVGGECCAIAPSTLQQYLRNCGRTWVNFSAFIMNLNMTGWLNSGCDLARFDNSSVVIGEASVESLRKLGGLGSSSATTGDGSGLSLHEHADGDVVVVSQVLRLRSVLLSNGLESVVADNLTEGLESDTLHGVKLVGGDNLKVEGLLLIDGHADNLGRSSLFDLRESILTVHGLKGLHEEGSSLGARSRHRHSSREQLSVGIELDEIILKGGVMMVVVTGAGEASRGGKSVELHYFFIINLLLF